MRVRVDGVFSEMSTEVLTAKFRGGLDMRQCTATLFFGFLTFSPEGPMYLPTAYGQDADVRTPVLRPGLVSAHMILLLPLLTGGCFGVSVAALGGLV